MPLASQETAQRKRRHRDLGSECVFCQVDASRGPRDRAGSSRARLLLLLCHSSPLSRHVRSRVPDRRFLCLPRSTLTCPPPRFARPWMDQEIPSSMLRRSPGAARTESDLRPAAALSGSMPNDKPSTSNTPWTITHVLEDYSELNGGVASAVSMLVALTQDNGVDTRVLASRYSARPAVKSVVRAAPRPWFWSSSLKSELDERLSRNTVTHIHGIWMYPQWLAAQRCRSRSRQFILTPHNMLGGWLWRRGSLRRIKKSIYWTSVARPAFRHARIIQALNPFEREVLRESFFPSERIEVLPNPIDVDLIQGLTLSAAVDTARPYFLFLGRLHPVKGLELLIDAFLPSIGDLELRIAGSAADSRYEQALRTRAKSCKRIRFIGSVSGREKYELLKGAWLLCAPSYSEGLSMSALEALSSGTPVLTSKESGLADLRSAGSLEAELNVDSVRAGLQQAAAWTMPERACRSGLARQYARDRFSPAALAPTYLALYRSVVEG